MKATLRSGEVCPIHHSRTCTPCHKDSPRQSSPSQWFPGSRWSGKRIRTHSSPSFKSKPAVLQIEDEHYPGGVREICNDRELQRRKLMLIDKQHGCCGNPSCDHPFRDIYDAQTHHKILKGMGSAFRDDSLSNLIILCAECHRAIHDGKLNLEGVA